MLHSRHMGLLVSHGYPERTPRCLLTIALGLLTVSSRSYLISILRRQQVAQIWGKPIYVITSVAFIPLSSQSDAHDAITEAKESLHKQTEDDRVGDSDSSDDEDHKSIDAQGNLSGDDDLTLPATPEPTVGSTPGPPFAAPKRNSTIVEDVIEKKGQYGRFADRWFSRKGWSVEKRRTQGMSTNEPQPVEDLQKDIVTGDGVRDSNGKYKGAGSFKSDQNPTKAGESKDDVANSLLPKLIKTTKLMLASQSFYFSYDYDITRRLGSKDVSSSDVRFHKKVDPLVS